MDLTTRTQQWTNLWLDFIYLCHCTCIYLYIIYIYIYCCLTEWRKEEIMLLRIRRTFSFYFEKLSLLPQYQIYMCSTEWWQALTMSVEMHVCPAVLCWLDIFAIVFMYAACIVYLKHVCVNEACSNWTTFFITSTFDFSIHWYIFDSPARNYDNLDACEVVRSHHLTTVATLLEVIQTHTPTQTKLK